MSGRFGARLGRACAGRCLALMGGFSGRFAFTCILARTLAFALCGRFAVSRAFVQLGTHRLATRRLVACAIAALMSNVAMASQGRFQPLAAGGTLVAPFRRHQAAGTVANQMALAHGEQGFADHRPASGVVVAQQRLVQAATALALGNKHIATGAAHLVQRVFLRVIHGGGVGERRRVEVLHLIELEAVLFDPERQIDHVFIGGARVGGDKVGDQVLLLARLFGVFVEQLLELVVAAHARLHHLGERALLGVFRRNLEVAADVVLGQLLDIAGIFDRDVVTHTGGDQDLLDPLEVARLAIEVDGRAVVCVHMRADGGPDTGGTTAGLLGLGALAAQLVHVGGGAA